MMKIIFDRPIKSFVNVKLTRQLKELFQLHLATLNQKQLRNYFYYPNYINSIKNYPPIISQRLCTKLLISFGQTLYKRVSKILSFYVGQTPHWNRKTNKINAAKSKSDENCKNAQRKLRDFFESLYCELQNQYIYKKYIFSFLLC